MNLQTRKHQVAVIRYNAGNTYSVLAALARLGVPALLTADPEEIMQSEKVIFPGVGEARNTMRHLRENGLDDTIRKLTQPVLGICLGMQLLCLHTEEYDTECLGIIPLQVKRFRPIHGEKVPHMGWNSLEACSGPLFAGLPPYPYTYFVHSYYVETGTETCARTSYTLPFSAALQKDNFLATQFHPEKSGSVGEVILRNFLFTPSSEIQ